MSTYPSDTEQPKRVSRRRKALVTVYEIVVMGMMGALMLVSEDRKSVV